MWKQVRQNGTPRVLFIWFQPLFFAYCHQVHPLLDSRHSVCRRSFQSLWPISWSRMAAVSFLLWVLWWSVSKPSSLSYLRSSTRSKVQTALDMQEYRFKTDAQSSSFPLFFVSVSVLHTVEEDTVEFSWKRNRLFNHTACLVLYQICMEVRASLAVHILSMLCKHAFKQCLVFEHSNQLNVTYKYLCVLCRNRIF